MATATQRPSRLIGGELTGRVHPTVVHMLVDAAERAPEREALVFEGERLTYAAYLRCVVAFADELERRGARGQRVAIILGNSLDIAVAYFAIHAAGAVAVPLNPAYTERELRELLDDCAPFVVIYDAARAAALEPIFANLGIGERVACGAGHRRLSVVNGAASGELRSLPGPNDPATIQYTGGTSGRPKGVVSLHGPMAINVTQRDRVVTTRPEDERVLCVMPMFHVYASSTALYLSIYARGTLIILPRYTPEAVLKTIAEHKVTFFPGSPTIYTGLLNYEHFSKYDLSHLRVCHSGASALPEQVLQRWREATGCAIYEGYGQSEAGPVLTSNPVGGHCKARSVGVVMPLTEIEIVDVEAGRQTLPVGSVGEIRVRGPQMMAGYRNRPEETAAALRDGWLYTSDLGEVDDDGYLYIRDRKKDMVIVSGFNVYPREIENVLYSHEAIKEAAVIGAPDAYRGEIVKAFVTLRAGTTASESELLNFSATQLTKYKVPASIAILDEMPKTGVGKIDKIALKRLHNPT